MTSKDCIGLAECLLALGFATYHVTKANVAYLRIPREARTRWFSAMRRFLASSYSFGVHVHRSSAMVVMEAAQTVWAVPLANGLQRVTHKVCSTYMGEHIHEIS